jgi:branched-chain amino acid transport system ATP-binding protein
MELLEFFKLTAQKDELAGKLPHGHQRALGAAIALSAHPEILLLDEPVTGMNALETTDFTNTLKKIRDDRGITLMLVEHNMRAVMTVCDRIIVINFGKKIAEGLPHEICSNKEVIRAYLGSAEIELSP